MVSNEPAKPPESMFSHADRSIPRSNQEFDSRSSGGRLVAPVLEARYTYESCCQSQGADPKKEKWAGCEVV